MESTDRELLIEINGRLVRIETRLGNLESRMGNLESRVGVIEQTQGTLLHEQELTRTKVEGLQTSIYWGFAVIAFVAAFVSIPRGFSAKNESAGSVSESMKYMLDILKLTTSRMNKENMNKENPPE